MNPLPDKLISRSRAAEITGLSPRTILRWGKAGLFPAPVKIGRLVRYSLREILQFIDELKAGRGETPWARRREDREHARVEHQLRLEELENLRTAPRALPRRCSAA